MITLPFKNKTKNVVFVVDSFKNNECNFIMTRSINELMNITFDYSVSVLSFGPIEPPIPPRFSIFGKDEAHTISKYAVGIGIDGRSIKMLDSMNFMKKCVYLYSPDWLYPMFRNEKESIVKDLRKTKYPKYTSCHRYIDLFKSEDIVTDKMIIPYFRHEEILVLFKSLFSKTS